MIRRHYVREEGGVRRMHCLWKQEELSGTGAQGDGPRKKKDQGIPQNFYPAKNSRGGGGGGIGTKKGAGR